MLYMHLLQKLNMAWCCIQTQACKYAKKIIKLVVLVYLLIEYSSIKLHGYDIRYDTIGVAILTCAQKLTRISLIYRTEPN